MESAHKECNRFYECLCDPTVPTLDQPDIAELQEQIPSADPEVVSETPTLGDRPNKLSIYFVLNGGKVPATGGDSPDELGTDPVDNAATFIEISMNFASEKPREIHDLLRTCVGVIVQTKDASGQPQITPLAVNGAAI